MGHATAHLFGPMHPGALFKRVFIIKFNYKVNFKRVGICDGASSTAQNSYQLYIQGFALHTKAIMINYNV